MNNNIDSCENIVLQWQREQEKRLQAAKTAATEVAKALKARGIVKIEFDYRGSSDRGCIEACYTSSWGKILKEERETLENLIYKLLPSGWDLSEGSAGTVTFDLKTGVVSVEHKWLQYIDDDSISGLELELSRD